MSIVKAPDLLMPKEGTDMRKWAVVACDQFTSQPEYWDKLDKLVGQEPSTLRIVFPEAYLSKDNAPVIERINKMMREYLDNGVLCDVGQCMVLVERSTEYAERRLGLVLAVDLEAYSFKREDKALIRATEGTVVERIPPRVKIRENAPVELPHIMLLIDDREQHIIENLYANRESYPKLYDFELNMSGGHVTGYRIDDTKPVVKALDRLKSRGYLKRLYGSAKEAMQFAVGDGNHSLATAKACWDNLKKTLSPRERKNHPARYALVEVMNLHDEGLKFEPIHRVVFNAGEDFVVGFEKICKGEANCVLYTTQGGDRAIKLPKNAAVAVGMVQDYIDAYIASHPDAKVDYVHGYADLKQVVDGSKDSVGITLPPLDKNDLFDYVLKVDAFPRKTFSMGEATEKRYYIESKKIK